MVRSPPRMRSALLAGGLTTIALGWAVSLYAIHSLESRESDAFGEPSTLQQLESVDHHLFVATPAYEGQNLVLEVCADDGFETGAWTQVEFEIWFLDEDDRISSHAFADLQEHVRRNRLGDACVTVATSSGFGATGEIALGMAYPELDPQLADVRVYGHIAAWTPLGLTGRAGLWLILLGTIAFLSGFAWPPKPDPLVEEVAPHDEPARWTRVAAGLALVVAALFSSLFFQGRMLGALGGLVIAAVEIGAAWWLVAAIRDDATAIPHRRFALGMVKPRKGLWLLALAPVVGVVVWFAGRLLMLLVPSTGVSPVETFVSFPSGALAMGSVAVFVPVAEEIFFRGFLYGTVERLRGANIATLVTIVLFAVVHLPQQWGAWGAFAAVTTTGIVLTLLRRFTGSTLLTALVHLAHNAFITMWALM